MAGVNRAQLIKSYNNFSESITASSQRGRPCIFLSHISIDKNTAIKIGDYIREKGNIDIYLDIYDDRLKNAVALGDQLMITKYIEEGLEQSTHIMCLVSQSTVQSWWVPYELGFGKSARKRDYRL